ncbi:MAG: pantoate--beta-alanine ligase [Bacteroidota bacterium]
MITLSHISELRSRLASFRAEGKSIGLVPTMGFLHEGHLTLIRKAKSECDIVVVSIFVNPTQFAPHEDLEKYPRDINGDSERASGAGCDLLFIPAVSEMYPDGYKSYVSVDGLSSVLEGEFRPTHFKGVATVVLKLFNIVQPHCAYFGQKDAQQSIVIKKMVKDLDVPVTIIIVPTMREQDGLAMSSRNVYLDHEQRKNAVVLSRALALAKERISKGIRDPQLIIAEMREMVLTAHPTSIDYIEVVDSELLTKKGMLLSGDSVLIPLAVRFGSTRLIDNIIVPV